jgi:putative transposase
VALTCSSHRRLAAENLFLRKQLACDFFVAVTATFRLVYVFLMLEIGSRRILHWNVTEHPTAEWTAQQFRSVLTGDEPHRFVATMSRAVDHQLPHGHRVVATPILAGLHHEYRLEPIAA